MFKACVCYFSLFLKDKCISLLFRMQYIEKKLTYSCFFLPLFHKHLFSPGLPCTTHLLETSFSEKITVCVIDTMLVTLPLVQMNKEAQREVNWKNQIQAKINIMKGLQMSVTDLIPGSTCHSISDQMRYFLKTSFGWNIFQRQLIAEAGICGCFLWNLFWKCHKFPRRTFPVSAR